MPSYSLDLKDLISRSVIIDAHTHSDRYSGTDKAEMIRQVEEKRILTLSSSTDPASIRASRELHSRCPWILTSAGIHPWNAGAYSPEDILELEPLYAEALQISEIGMDGLWAPEDATLQKQTELLEVQLYLGEKYRKPVTIHTKDAEDRVLDLLKRYSPHSVLVHWFDGSDRQLASFLDRGCLFTIPPAIITQDRTREIITKIPLDRLMPETDNPPTWPWLFNAPPKADQIFQVLTAASRLLNRPEDELMELSKEALRNFLGES